MVQDEAPSGPQEPALEDLLLQRTLESQLPELHRISHGQGAQKWLRPSLHSERGTEQLLAQLEAHVQQDSFLAQLQKDEDVQPSAPSLTGSGGVAVNKDWWSVTEADVSGTKVNEQDLESYVVVQHEDVLEAIGCFVAAYLSTLPEAQNMQPKQLQQALTQTFKELRQSRIRTLWRWGQSIYRCAAVTYSAFSLYTNPWLVRAVLAAIWTASRIMVGFV